jgi:membrane associated rhomboid family serine protease
VLTSCAGPSVNVKHAAPTCTAPTWPMLVYWMVIHFFRGLQSIGAARGVAFGAHIGGFIAGMVPRRKGGFT